MNRIERIKSRLFQKDYYTKIEWWGENETILTSDEIRAEPLVVRKALAIEHLLRHMPAELKPDELIVGKINMLSVGYGREFPQYALPEEKENGRKNGFTEKNVAAKHPADYAKLLRVGVRGIKEEIYAAIEKESQLDKPDEEKLNLWRAMLISVDAVVDFAHRYADLLLKEAKTEKDPQRVKELLEMARICNRVPEYPAETYREALQSFFFLFAAFHSCMEEVAVGRPDQYFYPYYKKDIESGRMTKEQAEELTASWFVKFSERVQLDKDHWEFKHFTAIDENYDGGCLDDVANVFSMENDEDYNLGTSANHWEQNVILGGVKEDGSDATNELTYIMIEQWARLELISPVMSVRFHKNSPEALYDLCATVLRRGSGEPTIYNDEQIIPGLVASGIPLEEARGYSNDGCWEVLIPGKTNYQYGHVQVLLQLEYLLTRGKSLVRNQVEAPDFGDPTQFKDFEEFYQAFLASIRHEVDRIMVLRTTYWSKRYEIAPSVLFSAFLDDCIPRGLDIANGGAKWNMYTFLLTGLSNCVDSLMAIKKFVYDDKTISMEDLIQALWNNFEGQEPLRQMLVNRAPKFGNDIAEVDELAARLMKDFEHIVNERAAQPDVKENAESGFVVNVGCGTFESYGNFGHRCGASADGRRSQETVSANYSPSVGLDVNSPTAVIKSITCPDIMPYYSGGPLDMSLDADLLIGEDGKNRLKSLIKSFVELGGVMMNVNSTSPEMLEDAQVHPEKYPGLRVHLGGLSAYFIALAPEQQKIIINRTKHAL